MPLSIADWANETSLGDLIAAAKDVLEADDESRGFEYEPDQPTPYRDAVVDLVHRVAVNLAEFRGSQRIPDLTEISEAVEQEYGRQLHTPCPTHSPVRCVVIDGLWQCPVDGESWPTCPDEGH